MAPRKDYSVDQMRKAVEAVKNGDSVRLSAQKFGVPRITLYNKVTGKSTVDCTMGPKTILSKYEENNLVTWLITMRERRFPLNKEMLIDSVQKIVTDQRKPNPFSNNKPGKKWFQSFLRRHPDITEEIDKYHTISRDDVTKEDIRNWFDEIDLYLERRGLKNILEDPSRIYNIDEYTLFLSPKAGRVICKRGEKYLRNVCCNKKETLTVQLIANAAGKLAPPMIVVEEKFSSQLSETVPVFWGISKSETGWINGNTFYEFLTNIFNPWLEQQDVQKPILLFVNGKKPHMTLHASNYCLANGIEVIALYPNSTNIMQPMDLAVFRPLKQAWRKEVSRWQSDNFEETLKKENFASVFQNAISSISEDCIQDGFRTGGLHPFCHNNIDMSKLKDYQHKRTLMESEKSTVLRPTDSMCSTSCSYKNADANSDNEIPVAEQDENATNHEIIRRLHAPNCDLVSALKRKYRQIGAPSWCLILFLSVRKKGWSTLK